MPPALQLTTNIRVSALVETFQSHLDGGLASSSDLVVDSFTLESQTLWRGSKPLRNDLIKNHTRRDRTPTRSNNDIQPTASPLARGG